MNLWARGDRLLMAEIRVKRKATGVVEDKPKHIVWVFFIFTKL